MVCANERSEDVKLVSVFIVSVVVIAVIMVYCFMPPRRMPGFVLGDGLCDLDGHPATYRLISEGRYLKGEYCDAHRWIGFINSDPMRKVTRILLGAAVFGVVYSVSSFLSNAKSWRQEAASENSL
jgi:RsiW-degrading membrane proteinase PrsW (M82 family)